jgi:hypothetical protein
LIELYAGKLRAICATLMKLIGSTRVFAGGYIAQPDVIVIYNENEAMEHASDQEIDLNKGPEYEYYIAIQEDDIGIQENDGRGSSQHED